MFKRRNSIGMTIIELMLALSLSVFMIGLVFEIYLMAQNAQLTQTALISLQENIQIISQLLARHFRMTGYAGCARLTNDFPFYNHSIQDVRLSIKIMRYQNPDIKPGTDAITIWHAGVQNAMLTRAMRGHATLYATQTIPFAVGDNVIISDCKTAELFNVKHVALRSDGTQQIVTTAPLNKLYESNAEISAFELNSYFIGSTGRIDAHGQPVYALYVRENHGRKTELVEGIDAMQIELDTAEDGVLVSHNMNDVSDAAHIVGVSFAFKLIAQTNVILHKNEYVYVALR